MKIIFDSEEEKRAYMRRYCPPIFDVDDYTPIRCESTDCRKCWDECAIELEVKEVPDGE